ncbi:hypothetical protein HBB16_03725 [Pseudonocardia sp. MCCB 268]|nr:hypothetical protein [Pseudonocardia cytotoxica]
MVAKWRSPSCSPRGRPLGPDDRGDLLLWFVFTGVNYGFADLAWSLLQRRRMTTLTNLFLIAP